MWRDSIYGTLFRGFGVASINLEDGTYCIVGRKNEDCAQPYICSEFIFRFLVFVRHIWTVTYLDLQYHNKHSHIKGTPM